jgi:4-deoxy-L-threo-5-hexosulose-uronate ketol-isomerase
MEVRFSTDPKSLSILATDELRKSFLIADLFVPDAVPMVYSDIDRSITGSAVPVRGTLKLLSSKREMSAEYFAERREIGVINVGSQGIIKVDGQQFVVGARDALYIGRGSKVVEFASDSAENPALFYFVSYPAHKAFPTTSIKFSEAEATRLGSQKQANKRTIHKYIRPGGVESCQLVMGLTELEEGSVWNTMPTHTHQRRSEVYMYFNIGPNGIVVHMLGQPDSTRHIIVRNQQAVLSPSWSIHTGVGTQSYSFIWAMGGENQVFDDMDSIPMSYLK